MKKKLLVADLFCGAGGTSTGISQFCESAGIKLDLVAVNHWDRAVETHAANHPKAHHFCQDLTRLKPGEAVPGGKLDMLVASPECTHHSNARGGKPKNDQSRASAWIVLEWVNALQVDRVLIENVPEFISWGPLGVDAKPLKRKRGETFTAFVKALEASGYRVGWKLLNSADFGAATSRRRLFIQAVKGRRPLVWPEPTHSRTPGNGLFGLLPKWRAAREVIDWDLSGQSIFNRKRPLSGNTLARIEAGLRKFGGAAAEPFLVAMNYLKERGNDSRAVRSLDEPLPTITSQGNRFAFIVPQFSGSEPRSVDRPVGTVTTTSRGMGLCEPFLLNVANQGWDETRVRDIDGPMGTVTTKNGHALVEPYLADMRGTDAYSLENTARSLDEPHPTITAGGSHTALIEPFVMRADNSSGEGGHERRCKSTGEPLGTIHAGGGSFGIVEPFILPHRQFEQMDVDSVDAPHRTITATNGGNSAIVQPFVIPYYGTSGPARVSDPLATVTTKDRFGLVEPGVALDIRFRMLQPHELKSAMGFPADYIITGNRGEQVKQVGNAVEVNQARALAAAAFGGTPC